MTLRQEIELLLDMAEKWENQSKENYEGLGDEMEAYAEGTSRTHKLYREILTGILRRTNWETEKGA